jgi:hypothetical protein
MRPRHGIHELNWKMLAKRIVIAARKASNVMPRNKTALMGAEWPGKQRCRATASFLTNCNIG